MIWACPLGKELEESALIGSWQFLSRHLNASWTCENNNLYWFLWNNLYSAQAHLRKYLFTENTFLFWAECMSKKILLCNTFVRNMWFSKETRLKKNAVPVFWQLKANIFCWILTHNTIGTAKQLWERKGIFLSTV